MKLRRAYSPGEVMGMKIPRYEFTGPWLASIGRPARSGVWIVWGASGNGIFLIPPSSARKRSAALFINRG